MNLIDRLLEDHHDLRVSLKRAEVLLEKPTGTGLEDRLRVEKKVLVEALAEFLFIFDIHEALENRIMSRLLRLEQRLPPSFKGQAADPSLNVAVAQGHHSLKSITHILNAITSSSDLDHVYSIRRVLSLVREELDKHLEYEEKEVFPKLREMMSPQFLEKLTRRTRFVSRFRS